MSHRTALERREPDFAPALTETERICLEKKIIKQDMHEGLAAIMERRPPSWKHRQGGVSPCQSSF